MELANKTKQKLFAIVSHDLLSPYNALYLQTKAINKQFKSDNSNLGLKTILNKIEQGVTQNYLFVKDMLIWAKANNDNIKPNMTSISISDCIQYILEPYSLIIEEKVIDVKILREDDLLIKTDSDLLSILLSNLLSNALKHTEKHGVISFDWKMMNNTYYIEIQDSGAGLTSEEIEYLNRNLKAEKPQDNQNGIGLSICKDILTILDGTLNINSTFGKGTTVQIEINRP